MITADTLGNTPMTLISREPWWLVPPQPGQKEQDLHWGYLEIYADGRTVFVDQRPSDRELAERKSCRNFPDPEK
ncbi:hypothetical protein PspTeo4_21208 [Pseudomonas sp. Teo4]|nr:hypothetical protein [Pseudomonas sp. Teo4]